MLFDEGSPCISLIRIFINNVITYCYVAPLLNENVKLVGIIIVIFFSFSYSDWHFLVHCSWWSFRSAVDDIYRSTKSIVLEYNYFNIAIYVGKKGHINYFLHICHMNWIVVADCLTKYIYLIHMLCYNIDIVHRHAYWRQNKNISTKLDLCGIHIITYILFN